MPAYIAAEIAKTMGGSLFTVNLDRLSVGSQALDWSLRNLALPLAPFLIFDFFYYWHHRLQHMLPALWAQHKLHHTEESLCCLTNLRHHWLEDGIRAFTITIPMAMLIYIATSASRFYGNHYRLLVRVFSFQSTLTAWPLDGDFHRPAASPHSPQPRGTTR